MTDLEGLGRIADDVHRAMRGRYRVTLRTTLYATVVLTATWFGLSAVGAGLDRIAGLDLGLGLGLLALVTWPIVAVSAIRRARLDGVMPWFVVGAGSLVISSTVYLTTLLVIYTLILGQR